MAPWIKSSHFSKSTHPIASVKPPSRPQKSFPYVAFSPENRHYVNQPSVVFGVLRHLLASDIFCTNPAHTGLPRRPAGPQNEGRWGVCEYSQWTEK